MFFYVPVQKAMDVFISYSRKDRSAEGGGDVISLIQQLLRKDGITYWLDEEGIYSGDSFASVISRNIAESKVFLFISSVNSNASRWTCGEIATANSYEKRIIPFKIDQAPYDPSITIYLAALDTIDYAANPEKALRRLMQSLRNYLREQEIESQRMAEEQQLKEEQEKARMERERIMAEREREIEKISVEQSEVESKIRTMDIQIDSLLREKHRLLEELNAVKAQISSLMGDSDGLPLLADAVTNKAKRRRK